MSLRSGWVRAFLAIGLVMLAAGAGVGSASDDSAKDEKTRAILAKLEEPVELHFDKAPLEDVLKFIKKATQGSNDSGIPIYVDPVGLQEAEQTIASPVSIDAKGEPLKSSLKKLLKPLGLIYQVKDGLLTITSKDSEDVEPNAPKNEGAEPK